MKILWLTQARNTCLLRAAGCSFNYFLLLMSYTNFIFFIITMKVIRIFHKTLQILTPSHMEIKFITTFLIAQAFHRNIIFALWQNRHFRVHFFALNLILLLSNTENDKRYMQENTSPRIYNPAQMRPAHFSSYPINHTFLKKSQPPRHLLASTVLSGTFRIIITTQEKPMYEIQ